MRRGTWVSVTALSPHPVRAQPQPAFKNTCEINGEEQVLVGQRLPREVSFPGNP